MCVVDDCIEVLPNGPLLNLAEYKAFLFLDLENLSFIIEKIIANADNSLTFQFLDGSSCNVDLQSRSLSKKQEKRKQVESHTKECKFASHENAIYIHTSALPAENSLKHMEITTENIAVTSAILTIDSIAEKHVDSWRISVLTLWRLSG